MVVEVGCGSGGGWGCGIYCYKPCTAHQSDVQ